MESPSYTKELQVAIAAVRQAARLSQHILSQASSMGVVSKDDLSPVTIADFAIQALLTCTLHHAFPEDRFVGEESSAALRENPALLDRVWQSLQFVASSTTDDGDAAPAVVRIPASADQMCEMIDWCGNGRPSRDRGASARVWVFDPIDGTENFVNGLVYAINVALLDSEAQHQVLSVVGCPNMSVDVAFPATDSSLDPAGEGALAYGVRGKGAFVRKLHAGSIVGDDDLLPAEGSGNSHSSSSSSRRLPRHADAAETTIRSVTATSVSSGLAGVHAAVAARLGVAFPGNDLLPWVLRWLLLALGVGNATWWLYQSRARLGKIWDHSGAMLLFEEVGGKVTDADGRAVDLFAGRTMTANYGFVAAPAGLHAHVLGAVREVLAKERPDIMAAQSSS